MNDGIIYGIIVGAAIIISFVLAIFIAKRENKQKLNKLKPISTKNLVIAECVELVKVDSDSYTVKHYSPKKYVLVRFPSTFYDFEKYYTDVFTGTDYYLGSNSFAEVGSIVVDNLLPLNIPYPYITYEEARDILLKVNSWED